MSRTKSFAVNSLAAALLQVATLLVGFILPKVILVTYGSSVNGLVSSVTQLVSYLLLVEAGLNGAAVYSLYKPIASNNLNQINTVLSTVHSFYKKSGYIFLVLLIFSSLAYPLLVSCEGLSNLQVTILILVIGSKGVFDFFFMGKCRALLTADQKIFVVSISSMSALIVSATVILSLAYYDCSVVTAYSFAMSALLIKSLILYGYVKSKYTFLDTTVPQDKTTISQRWDVLYLQVLGVIQQGVPIIALTLFATLPIVSIYAIYNMVIVGLAGVLGIFINGLFSSFGDVIAKNEIQILKKTYSEFEYSYYVLITWVYMCSVVLIIPFVTVYTEGVIDIDYVQPLFGLLIVLNAYLYNLKTPQGMLVISAGLYRQTRWQTTAQGAIALILCFSLAQKMTLVGVTLGVMASNIYRDIDLFLFIPKHVTKLPVRNTIIRVLRSMCLVFFAVLYSFYYPLYAVSLLEWAKVAVVVAVSSGVIVIVFNLLFEPALSRDIYYRVHRLFKGSATNI